MFSNKVIVLTVLTFISTFNVSASLIFRNDDEDLNVGEKCMTKNNEPGICTELLKCSYADQLYKSKQSSKKKITLCKLVGRIPFVCCPSFIRQSYASPPVVKTSTKFQNALCKNLQVRGKIDDHIIDGKKAIVGEFPFQVALGYKSRKSWDFKCGGSLIADDVVLTAAHCVNKKEDLPIIVRMGRTSLDLKDEDDESNYQDIKIEAIRVHPKYSMKYKHNDIAIIKLRKSFKPSSTIDTVCLSTSDTDAPKDFVVTGFGLTSLEYKKISDWLLKGTISIYPHDKCKNEFGKKGIEIIDSQLCALNKKGVDACHGDSGGPVSYEKNNVHYLHGIISFGSGCGSSEFPSIYTKVNRYLDWIEEEMSTFE